MSDSFEGFYGFHIQYRDGRKPESKWFLTEQLARLQAQRIGKRKSVEACHLVKKVSDGSMRRMKPRRRRRKRQ